MNGLQALGVALGSLGMALFSSEPATAHSPLLRLNVACELSGVDWESIGAEALHRLAQQDEAEAALAEERADIPDRHIHARARL